MRRKNPRIAPLWAAAFLISTGCASGPAGPPPLDPLGSYDYAAMVQGLGVTGTMTIEAEEDGYGGQITSNIAAPIPINRVEVVGQAVTIYGTTPEGPLLIEIVMTGAAFEGHFAMGPQSGSFSGMKVPE